MAAVFRSIHRKIPDAIPCGIFSTGRILHDALSNALARETFKEGAFDKYLAEFYRKGGIAMLEKLRDLLGRPGDRGGKKYDGDAGAGPHAGNTVVKSTIMVNGKAVTERDLDPETREELKNAVRGLEDLCEGVKTGEPVVVHGRPATVVSYSTSSMAINGKEVVEKDMDPETREILQNAMKRLEGFGEKTVDTTIVYRSTTVNGKKVAEKDMDPETREILQNAMKRLEALGEKTGGHGTGQQNTGAAEKARQDGGKVPCIFCGMLVGATATECPGCGMSLRR